MPQKIFAKAKTLSFEQGTWCRLALPTEYKFVQFFVEVRTENHKGFQANSDRGVPVFAGEGASGQFRLRLCVHCAAPFLLYYLRHVPAELVRMRIPFQTTLRGGLQTSSRVVFAILEGLGRRGNPSFGLSGIGRHFSGLPANSKQRRERSWKLWSTAS
jgi:hypothetical protein